MAVNPKISPPVEVTDVLKGLRPRQNKTRELDIPVQYLLDIIRAQIGEAAWGSITAGTGVASQADLVAYLAANYVPQSRTLTINGITYDLSANRSWTISASGAAWGSIAAGTGVASQADLVAYLAANYVPLSRTITINGVAYDLTANRSWIITPTPVPAGEIEGTIVGGFRSYRNCTGHRVIPDYDQLWVASINDSRVDVYDTNTGELLLYISLTNACGVIYVESIDEVWLTQSTTGTIKRYDPATLASAGADITGSGNGGSSYHEYSATKVFIANPFGNTVTVVNPSTLTVDATLTAAALGTAQCTSICYVDYASSNHFGYIAGVSNSDSKFFAINASTNAVAISGTSISTNSPSCLSIDYNPVNDRYYISSFSGQNLGRYEPNSSSTIAFEYGHPTRLTREVRVNKTTGKVYVTSLVGSGTGLNGLVAVQCFDNDGLLWALPTISDASATSYFGAYLSIDTENGYLYANGVSLVATNYPMITKIKI